MEQVSSPEVWPTRGVGPGSAWAIFELAGYLAEDIEAVVCKYQPALELNVHADDFTTRVMHESRAEALRTFLEAGTMLASRIEGGKIARILSVAKSQLLANDDQLLTAADKAMDRRAGTTEPSVRRLG